MITVEKIGGTSMSRFDEVLRNIMLRDSSRVYGRVYVVSAYAGVTNELLEHKKTGVPGVYAKFAAGDNYAAALDALLGKLKAINQGFAGVGLDLGVADGFLERRMLGLKGYLDSMRHVLASGYLRRDNVLLAAREMLAAIGEAHSAFNSVEILRAKGVRALFMDLTGFDDDDAITIDERIHKSFVGVDPNKEVVIATGYTKGVEGIMREFDRGYSEVTFSKIAVEIRPAEAVIHKEFHLSSADPEIVGAGNTVVVGATNYDVADQLADVGMEAIHPKAAKPMELAGIPIRLKNTFEPDHPGTLITKDYVGEKARIEVIAGTTKVMIVEIHDPLMVGTVGFDLGLMEIFKKYGISYILKATNANSITHVVWEKSVTPAFAEELENAYEQVTVAPAAVVCVIGSNMAIPGVLARAAQVLADNDVNVNCFSQSYRQVNMQFVIDRGAYKRAIVALNQALCLGQKKPG
ncbi:MAG TPA: aspartate kinase [Anaeromyxobacteraceae bacterium]|nr:aspartate kinase [Anaeromyxobacteraceae bacterium]